MKICQKNNKDINNLQNNKGINMNKMFIGNNKTIRIILINNQKYKKIIEIKITM